MISPCTDEGVKPELGGIEWKVGWQLEMNSHHLFLLPYYYIILCLSIE